MRIAEAICSEAALRCDGSRRQAAPAVLLPARARCAARSALFYRYCLLPVPVSLLIVHSIRRRATPFATTHRAWLAATRRHARRKSFFPRQRLLAVRLSISIQTVHSGRLSHLEIAAARMNIHYTCFRSDDIACPSTMLRFVIRCHLQF